MKHTLFITALLLCTLACAQTSQRDTATTAPHKHYREIQRPTPNLGEGRNEVRGIILHHTAEPTAERAMTRKLCNKGAGVSSHVVVDLDGTRYILAQPTQVTWHAGKSRLDGRDGCNRFTVGIEIQGNTLEEPLTDDQIASVVEYIIPLMRKYHIPLKNIVTHEMIRNNWLKAHPEGHAYGKVDITPKEYERVMTALRARLSSKE